YNSAQQSEADGSRTTSMQPSSRGHIFFSEKSVDRSIDRFPCDLPMKKINGNRRADKEPLAEAKAFFVGCLKSRYVCNDRSILTRALRSILHTKRKSNTVNNDS